MKILIVGDEHIEQKALAKMLEKFLPDLGATLLYAMDGVQAVEVAREHDPTIIFMDIQLPLKNGLQAAQEIREFNSQALLVMVTAYSEFEYARKALQNDTFDYLVKPYSLKTFNMMMERLLYKLSEIQSQSKHRKQFGKLQELLQSEFMQKLLLGPPLTPEKVAVYVHSLGLHGKVFQCTLWLCNRNPDELLEKKFELFLLGHHVSFMKKTFQNIHYLIELIRCAEALTPLFS